MGYSPTEYAEFTEPPTEMSSHGFLLRRVWHLAIPTPPAMGYSPTEYAEFTEPPTEMSSHGFLLRRVWHLAIPTPPAMGYSPTEYAEFTEPPTEMSSHGFLLRRVWHLAIPTPPAMGYSPTEYTEFTEPPTEMSSHGFHRIHRICQRGYGRDAIPSYICVHPCSSVGGSSLPEVSVSSVRSVGISFLPQNSQNTQNLAAWVWQGCHTLLHLCASVLICGRLFSARSFCVFRAFCGNIFSPTDFTDLHRYLWCAVLPQNSQNTQNLSAWVWQGCHTLLHLCASVSSVGGSSLPEVSVCSVLICGRFFSARSFCEFRAFCGNLFSPTEFTEYTEFGSVGMAGMPYPPTSVNIRVICGSPFSARGSVSSVCSVGISFLPRISQSYTDA